MEEKRCQEEVGLKVGRECVCVGAGGGDDDDRDVIFLNFQYELLLIEINIIDFRSGELSRLIIKEEIGNAVEFLLLKRRIEMGNFIVDCMCFIQNRNY